MKGPGLDGAQVPAGSGHRGPPPIYVRVRGGASCYLGPAQAAGALPRVQLQVLLLAGGRGRGALRLAQVHPEINGAVIRSYCLH